MRAHPPAVADVRRGEALTFPSRRARGALLLLLCACWFPKERGQRLEERVERVEGEGAVRAPSEDRAAAQEQLRRLEARLAAVQSRLDELGAGQKAATEQPGRQDKVGEEVSRLRATVETYGRRLDAMEKALAQRPPAAGSRVARGKGASAPEASAKPEAPAPEAPQVKPGGVLALAREQEMKGQKGVARDLYQEYVNRFPNDPSAAQAHFRLGELAFGERRYRDAIAEYGRIAKDFPRAEQAPDALLRTAESMVALGMKDDATAVLSEIPKRYPASPAASRAKQRIAELKGASAPPSNERR